MKVWPFDTAAERTRGQWISRRDLANGVGILEAIRDEAGDEMDILVEMHSLWSLKPAVEILAAIEHIRPFWVEDPIRTDSADSYRRIRERVNVPIAAGETVGGARAFKPLLDAGGLDVGIVDVGWSGGLSEALRTAHLFDAYGMSFAPHDCTGPLSFAVCTHFAASQENTLVVETVRAFHHGWYPEVFSGLPEIIDGEVRCTGSSGFGVKMRPEFAEAESTSMRTTRIL